MKGAKKLFTLNFYFRVLVATRKERDELTLPEGQEDDRFNGEKFEHRFERSEQVTGGEEEEEEGVEGQADGEVVDDCDVQVSSIHTAKKGIGRAPNSINKLQSSI